MIQRNFFIFSLIAILVLPILVFAQTDNDNMLWKKSWTSPVTTNGARDVALEEGVYVPGRSHPFEAWFDIDGDGNQEMIMTDNDFDMTYIYENAGDDNYEYRWFFCMFNDEGGSILDPNDGRLSGAVDMDGDGADEFYNIGLYAPEGDPLHSAALKIWKHEAGSDEFLPPFDEWTVEYDDLPSGRDDMAVVLEYTGGAGDWDNDGNAEIALNYKKDPAYFFSMLEVVGPVTQDGISFNIEVEIPRRPYMIEPEQLNVARTWGKDLDNDGFDELLLTNRNNLTQCAIYLDCNGEDDWTLYEWTPDMPRVFPDSIRAGENSNFADIDGDGIFETLFMFATGRGVQDTHAALWVTKINPLDPANMFSYDAWAKLKTVDEMLGYPADSLIYTSGSGFVEVGDADGDNLTDVYFSIGETGGSRLMDVEFVGTDYKNPDHYNYYSIVHCPSASGVDSSAAIRGSRGTYGDGDKDGKPDIVHNNNRSSGARPALFVWEYDAAAAKVDNDNMLWKKSWTSPVTTNGARDVALEEGVYVPGRSHPFEAWFDIDGDGNQEMIMTDNDFDMTYIYENAGDDNYEYRWFFCMFNDEGGSILDPNDGRLSGAVDMDGDGADEFYNIGLYAPEGDPLHSAALKIWKHEAGSDEFLPPFDEWTVEYDDLPSGRDDMAVVLEYTGGAGDWDNDGNAEIALNYKKDPAYFFSMLEVVGPVTQDGISFNIEVEIPRRPYMIEPEQLNVARTWGKDLDNDGFDELLLTNRNNLTQCAIYLDCNGEDDWTLYEWTPDMPRVFPDSIRAGENSNFADIDGDGIFETLFMFATGRGVQDTHAALWVTKINPLDPANMFSYDAWAKLKTVDEMLGYPADSLIYTSGSGFVEVGDADGDNLTDVYFSIGETGGSRLMDVEFVGTDYKNPDHYNYYSIVHCPSASGVDSSAAIRGSRGTYGDGDKDGKPDIVHNNNRSSGARPALFVWEYGSTSVGVENKLNDNSIPSSFDLNQNYPNPFNPTTTISYSLAKNTKIRLDIYNINGKLVKTLVNDLQVSGQHNVTWDALDNQGNRVSSGIYFYSLVANSQKVVKKMTLIK